MFDCAPSTHTYLSHDRPCPRCGHAIHRYLACSDRCACAPDALAGSWVVALPSRPRAVGG